MNANMLRSGKSWLVSGLVSTFAIGAVPAVAAADHTQLSIGFGLDAQRLGMWVPPVYESRPRAVIVPAVYQDRVRKVWHEPVYDERRVAVEIPADIVERHVPRYDRHGHVIGYETVRQVVRPARTEWRVERVCVREGWFENTVDRVMVKPETTRIVYEDVLVRAGFWAPPSRHVIHKDRDRHVNVSFGFRR